MRRGFMACLRQLIMELWGQEISPKPVLTSVQLFRYDRKLTACALGEPSITLVRNDSQFGLLLAAGAHEDSFTSRLYLDDVSYLRIADGQESYTDFDCVTLFSRGDVWLAQDTASGRYFPSPSELPYHVIFISQEEFRRLRYARTEGLVLPVFEVAQRHFGLLPGFSFSGRSLETPDDYATREDAVPFSDYVFAN